MRKQDVINRVTAQTGLDPEVSRFILETFYKVVKDSLIEGKPIYIRTFGSFILKRRAGKTARNINAKTAVSVAPRVIPLFKPSTEFVDQVKQGGNQRNSANTA
ncbi:HU family DNA-binding protein [Spirosoma arcticum]